MRNFPVVVPSYNRPHCPTSVYLQQTGVEHIVIVNDTQKFDLYAKHGAVPERLLHIAHQKEKGITYTRNYILELMPLNNWFITMDDNIHGFKGVRPELYGNEFLDVQSDKVSQKDYDHLYHANELIAHLKADIEVCESIGAKYGGTASVDNYFFNSKKYRTVGYLLSKCAYIYNEDGLYYDLELEAMEEFGFLAEQFIRNGKVLINGFIKSINNHYEEGGIGTYEQRLPRKITDCKYLMEKYPGLLRYKIKKNCHPKAELQFRVNNEKQVQEWIAQMAANKNQTTLF